MSDFDQKIRDKAAQQMGTGVTFQEDDSYSPSLGVPMQLSMTSDTDSGMALKARRVVEDRLSQGDAKLNALVPEGVTDKVEYIIDEHIGTNPNNGELIYMSDDLADDGKYVAYYLEPQTKGYGARKFAASMAQETPVLLAEVFAARNIAKGRGVVNRPTLGILTIGAAAKQVLQRISSGEETTLQNLQRSGGEALADITMGLGVLKIGQFTYNRQKRKILDELAMSGDDWTARYGDTPTLSTKTPEIAGGASVLKETIGEQVESNPEMLDESQRVQDLAVRSPEEGGIGEPLTPDQLMDGSTREQGDLLRRKGITGTRMNQSLTRQTEGAESLFIKTTGADESEIFLSAKEVQEAATNFIDNQKNRINARIGPYYKKAYEQSIPPESLQGLLDFAQEYKTKVLAGFSKSTSPTNKLIKDLTKEVVDETGKKTNERVLRDDITIEQIHNARIEIDRLIDYDKAGGRNFTDELRNQFDIVLKSVPEFAEADAKAAFRLEYISKLENSVMGDLSKAIGEDKAKTLFRTLFGGGISPTALKKAKLKIQKTNPEAWNNITKSYMADVLDTATTSNVGGQGNWVGKIYSQLWGNKKRRAIIEAMLDEDAFVGFEEMMTVFGYLRTTPQIGAQTFGRFDLDAIVKDASLMTKLSGKARKSGYFIKALNFIGYREIVEEAIKEQSEKEILQSIVNIWTSPENIQILKEIASQVPATGEVSKQLPEETLRRSRQMWATIPTIAAGGVAAQATEEGVVGDALSEVNVDGSLIQRGVEAMTPDLADPQPTVPTATSRSQGVRDYREKYPAQAKSYRDGIRMQRLERKYGTKLSEALKISPLASVQMLEDHLIKGKPLTPST